jgi:OmcA/MtrC family decaheme c-type cytochrome
MNLASRGSHRPFTQGLVILATAAFFGLIGLPACSGGDSAPAVVGPQPPPPTPPAPPPPTTPLLSVFENLPGVVCDVTALTGGTGPGGRVQVGDYLAVNFTLEKRDGSALSVVDLNSASIYISGPTSNYQIVIPRQSNLIARSTQNGDGSWTYTFPVAVPAVYAPPLNDTTAFGATDGELTGQPLQSGTYTVGVEMYKNYAVENVNYRDAANETFDFLLGDATTLEPREVVKMENCQSCHTELRAHGEFRRDVKLCVLCHTSGAEDRNTASVEGGTPGVSIDFRVMIHKIHNAKHLPSVNGVATNSNGSRNYAATAQPYKMIGFGDAVIDFSDIKFPVWPNLSSPLPRDFGYSTLTTPQKAQEDEIRRGASACAKCHGDPDGTGPLTAPAQGQNAFDRASRRACGSCHDDIDWSKPYSANLLEMPPQTDDVSCNFCHNNTGTLIGVDFAHRHPISDPTLNPGVNLVIQSVAPSPVGGNADGVIDVGERIVATFTVTTDAGASIPMTGTGALASLSYALSGPNENRQLLGTMAIPLNSVTGGPTYTATLPENVILEFAGDSTAGLDVFSTSRAPHRATTGAVTTVFARTATGPTPATLFGNNVVGKNYLDVSDDLATLTTNGFVRDAYIVVEDGVVGKEEYLRIQSVEDRTTYRRFWFGAPTGTTYPWATRYAHASGSSVSWVTLTTKTLGTQYTLDAVNGLITEVAEFGAGAAVVVSYTSDFIVPPFYGPPINNGEDQGEAYGEWTGLPLLAGSYSLGMWGYQNIVVAEFAETQTYRAVSEGQSFAFSIGTTDTAVPMTTITSPANCNSCHDTVLFHGAGRGGLSTCIHCHGTSGFEDRPKYVAPNAPATPEATFDFRNLLHRIHHGKELSEGDSFLYVIGGGTTFPNNYSTTTFAEAGFPAMPGGTRNCTKCHGTTTDGWKEPAPRNHPAQTTPTHSWRTACGSCHDGSDVQAHIKAQTAPTGVESCNVCHGPGNLHGVELRHKPR